MRLSIYECVDERLRFLFPARDCQAERFANLAGLRNGRLLDAAEAAGFDVLIKGDGIGKMVDTWYAAGIPPATPK